MNDPAAEDALEDAVHQAALANECLTEGHLITSWILIGTTVGPEPNENGYFRMYSGGHMASHLALGLLAYATHGEHDWIDSDEANGTDQ